MKIYIEASQVSPACREKLLTRSIFPVTKETMFIVTGLFSSSNKVVSTSVGRSHIDCQRFLIWTEQMVFPFA